MLSWRSLLQFCKNLLGLINLKSRLKTKSNHVKRYAVNSSDSDHTCFKGFFGLGQSDNILAGFGGLAGFVVFEGGGIVLFDGGFPLFESVGNIVELGAEFLARLANGPPGHHLEILGVVTGLVDYRVVAFSHASASRK